MLSRVFQRVPSKQWASTSLQLWLLTSMPLWIPLSKPLLVNALAQLAQKLLYQHLLKRMVCRHHLEYIEKWSISLQYLISLFSTKGCVLPAYFDLYMWIFVIYWLFVIYWFCLNNAVCLAYITKNLNLAKFS